MSPSVLQLLPVGGDDDGGGVHSLSANEAMRTTSQAGMVATTAVPGTYLSFPWEYPSSESQPPPPYTEQLALRLRISLKRAAVAEGLLGTGAEEEPS